MYHTRTLEVSQIILGPTSQPPVQQSVQGMIQTERAVLLRSSELHKLTTSSSFHFYKLLCSPVNTSSFCLALRWPQCDSPSILQSTERLLGLQPALRTTVKLLRASCPQPASGVKSGGISPVSHSQKGRCAARAQEQGVIGFKVLQV